MDVKELAETAKKKAELSKKLEQGERKLKTQSDMLSSRLRHNEAIGTKHIDVKYAAKELERVKNELDKLK